MPFSRPRLGLMLQVAREYFEDYRIFRRHSGASRRGDPAQRDFYRAVIGSHSVEKGLSLRAVRPFFGQSKVRALLPSLERLDPGSQAFPLQMANGALREYVALHDHGGPAEPIVADISDYLDRQAQHALVENGGTKTYDASERVESAVAKRFLLSRHSCRNFDGSKLADSEILEAVRVAQSAPSQCNRQSVRVHVYRSQPLIAELLSLQRGASGFSEDVGTLFVIGVELSAWSGPGQRSQAYVDGGIFSHSLLLALHACQFDACMLNLAITNSTETAIKVAGQIPDNERLIAMVAAGNQSAQQIRVAASPRRNGTDVVDLHD